jgi:kynureninase
MGMKKIDLEDLSRSLGLALDSEEFAKHLDKNDTLQHLREQFHIPRTSDGREMTYLLGNSTGLQPKEARKLVLEDLEVWANRGNEGHFAHTFGRDWVTCDVAPLEPLSRLVGAQCIEELALMGTLTADLHLLMGAFYHPKRDSGRFKIVLEEHAFPSDHVRPPHSLFA